MPTIERPYLNGRSLEITQDCNSAIASNQFAVNGQVGPSEALAVHGHARNYRLTSISVKAAIIAYRHIPSL